MTLSLAGTRKEAGISIAEVNLKADPGCGVADQGSASHGQAYVVDAEGRLIAHPDIRPGAAAIPICRSCCRCRPARGRQPECFRGAAGNQEYPRARKC